jgi:hypothetical protein
MQPVYVKKADPRDRTTWMDKYIALEAAGGVRSVIDTARQHRARTVFAAIFSVVSESSRFAA